MKSRFLNSYKSRGVMVGAIVISLGLLLLEQNFSIVFSAVHHFLSGASCKSLGILPATILAASQFLRGETATEQGLLPDLLRQLLLFFWPMLLVIGGGMIAEI